MNSSLPLNRTGPVQIQIVSYLQLFEGSTSASTSVVWIILLLRIPKSKHWSVWHIYDSTDSSRSPCCEPNACCRTTIHPLLLRVGIFYQHKNWKSL